MNKSLSPPLQQVRRTWVRVSGRLLAYFAGCDYFRLSSHPRVKRALMEGLQRYGLGTSASRMTTGNHKIHGVLEERLARFFGAEEALLVSNGYVTNLAAAQALRGSFSHVLLDQHAHSSLADAAAMMDCPVSRYRHCDAGDLARVLRRSGRTTRPLVMTDGMFAYDGSVAPLAALLDALPGKGQILVDDAHGAGVIGATGRGSLEAGAVDRKRIIQTLTLSKAFGAYGGAVLASRGFINRIISNSSIFTGITPLPPPLANAGLAALEILDHSPELLGRLRDNSEHVKRTLRDGGWEIPSHPGPILAVAPKDPAQTLRIRRALLSKGVFPPFIKYPGGPRNGYFRFAISSEHTGAQLRALISALKSALAQN